jgi:hypothetical protein
VVDSLHVLSSTCSLMPLSRQVCPGLIVSAEEMAAGTLLAIGRDTYHVSFREWMSASRSAIRVIPTQEESRRSKSVGDGVTRSLVPVQTGHVADRCSET